MPAKNAKNRYPITPRELGVRENITPRFGALMEGFQSDLSSKSHLDAFEAKNYHPKWQKLQKIDTL